jgi:hypothetical protein
VASGDAAANGGESDGGSDGGSQTDEELAALQLAISRHRLEIVLAQLRVAELKVEGKRRQLATLSAGPAGAADPFAAAASAAAAAHHAHGNRSHMPYGSAGASSAAGTGSWELDDLDAEADALSNDGNF